MPGNEQCIHQFYAAFQNKDYVTMQELYHPDATFSDPVFQNLNSTEVKAMWEMLITSAKDLEVTFGEIAADQSKGTCRWDAVYTFSRTGRRVHNRIRAAFEFRDGRIVKHRDAFDFWRWSRQALGAPGLFLGWTPVVKNEVRSTARKALDKFMRRADHP